MGTAAGAAGGAWNRQRNWGARLRRLTVEGLPYVELENRWLRLGILAGRGADLVEWLYKPLDLDLAWRTPTGIVDPAALVPADGASAFSDAYPGGWQTVFPHGSVPAHVHGAPYGLHGEACLLPWAVDVLEDAPEAVAVRFSVHLRRMPFRIEKTIRLGDGATFELDEVATNESPVPLAVNWGQHVTFGPPFLEPGCRIVMPPGLAVTPHPGDGSTRRVALGAGETAPWPIVPAAGGGTVDLSRLPEAGTPSEMVYLTGFGAEGGYALEHPRLGVTARLAWDASIFPVCWCWQEFGASSGWPWFGRAWVLGLEPFAGFPPNAGAGPAAGREPLAFAPGETKRVRITASMEAGAEQAASA